jgi:hypothetical protein
MWESGILTEGSEKPGWQNTRKNNKIQISLIVLLNLGNDHCNTTITATPIGKSSALLNYFLSTDCTSLAGSGL